MLQRFPIRVKLFIALAVPLVALIAVAVFEVAQTSRQKSDIDEQAGLATSALSAKGLLSQLEDERNAAAIYLLGLEGAVELTVEDPKEAAPLTDEARGPFEDEVAGRGGAVENSYGEALANLSKLDELRGQVENYTGERAPANVELASQVFDTYSQLMGPFFDANRRAALEIDDPTLRRGAELIDLTQRQTDIYAKISMKVAIATIAPPADGVNSSAEISELSGLLGELQENKDLIRTKASGDYAPMVKDLLATDHIQHFPGATASIIYGTSSGITALEELLALASGPSAEEQGYTVFRGAVEDQLVSDSDGLVNSAEIRTWLLYGVGFVALVIAMLATWLVSRSITRPLRALTRQATDMANHRLPDAVLDILDTPLGDDVSVPAVDPVTVHTRDEVADVADALNTVQDSALDLAVEQAVLRRNIADSFVNLGRRNQNLLGRQLDFITELEHNEADPDTLGNLFRLDHLATRMRRNAESLLVLAGIDPPRKWAAPVRITDAIRAALGEVEDYQRVTVRNVEPTTVLGSAAADLAHLLAELIENALIFSPPDQTVEVRGRNQPTGYTLSVIDAGLGMPPDELARANRRLAGAESFTIAPSKYLGHYVAGNLAARHNINVTLHTSQTQAQVGAAGIAATINLPPSLLTVEPATHPDTADTAPGAPQLAPEPGMAMASPFDAVPPPPAAVDALPLEAPAAAAPPPAAFAAPDQSEELPQLSAPHLRVTPGHTTHEVPATRPPMDQPLPAPAPPPAPLQPNTGWESEMPLAQPSGDSWPAPQPSGDNWPAPQPSDDNWPAPEPAAPVGREEPPQQDAWPQVTQETPVSPFAPRSTPPRSATTQPARPSEELLKTLATYTTHLHRTIDTSRLTPPTGNPGTHFPNHARPTPAAPQGPQTPAPPPTRSTPRVGGPPPPQSAPEHTTSGLARRVRGAQIPRTQPVGLHRPDEPNVPANGQEPLTQAGARGVGDVSSSRVSRPNNTADPNSAKDVYSFLSSFSAGVQRGLDEARGDTRVPEEDQ